MKIQALKKSLVFRFNDAVTSKGEFNNGTTAGGIILQSSFDDSAKQPRWVTVVSSGGDNDPTIFKEGRVVLLPALRWTEASKFEGEKIWKSDSTQVVAYQSGEKLIPHDNYVIFIQKSQQVSQSASGLLVVVGSSDDTPSGTVVSAGENAATELTPGATIYYNATNFTDTFEFNGIKHAFIKDDELLAYEPA